MRVLILNTCSTLNRGDAAIVRGQIRLLRKYFSDPRITITSKTPAIDRSYYNPMGVEVLAPLTPALSLYRDLSLQGKLVQSARMLARWGDKKCLIQALRRSDLILSCGGGYLYSYRSILPGTTFWQNVIHVRLATLLNKPLVFLPQSFGPFGSFLARRGVKRLLEGQSIVRVFAREEISHQYLRSILNKDYHPRIALCPDMAFYSEENAGQHIPKSEPLGLRQPILAVNLREWAFPEAKDPAARRRKREEYLNALIVAARFFIQHYQGTVVVIPQALGPDPSEDDRGICTEFCQRTRECVPADGVVQIRESDIGSPTDLMGFLCQVALMIGTRLHSCILALLVGVPVISIGYQHKSKGTMDLLGLGRFNTDITELSPEWLLDSVEEIINHRSETQEKIRQHLSHAHAWIDDEVGTLFTSLGDGRV
jgi:colanic acid/amylovoran biosynthesis protein